MNDYRLDAMAKVTGAARYPTDAHPEGLAHSILVTATIAAGQVETVDGRAALAVPGVLAVITGREAAVLPQPSAEPHPLARREEITFAGQPVAVVVAETPQAAAEAARLVKVTYERVEPQLDLLESGPRFTPDDPPAEARGSGSGAAEVVVETTVDTPYMHHNPLGLFCTTAVWEGDRLIVHDTCQSTIGVRKALAGAFGLPPRNVRVLAPFVGGAFGAGLSVWPHVTLAAVAARQVGRPVRLALTRAQMFGSLGHRPITRQRVVLGATREGELTFVRHEGLQPAAMDGDYSEDLFGMSRSLYTCPSVHTSYQQVRLNAGAPTWMRAPGESTGGFATETAMDELAAALGMDPLELRRRNHSALDPAEGRPWSSNGLLECYRLGAERFGWSSRAPEPRSTRDGHLLVGYGMAASAYPYYVAPCQAEILIDAEGSVTVRTSVTDIGTGTGTAIAHVAASALGVPVERVRVELGDSALAPGVSQGGSKLNASVGSAVHQAALAARERLARAPGEPVAVTGVWKPALDPGYSRSAFGATFAEVSVDEDLGQIRVRRVVSAIDCGRVVSPVTARSQIIGGAVQGVGMALFEQGRRDGTDGRVINANLTDYLIPTIADAPDVDVLFVSREDRELGPIGAKGLGEIALIGVPPAIANAVFHATGRRVRDLPITMERLLPR